MFPCCYKREQNKVKNKKGRKIGIELTIWALLMYKCTSFVQWPKMEVKRWHALFLQHDVNTKCEKISIGGNELEIGSILLSHNLSLGIYYSIVDVYFYHFKEINNVVASSDPASIG